jgi:hypothetical protein
MTGKCTSLPQSVRFCPCLSLESGRTLSRKIFESKDVKMRSVCNHTGKIIFLKKNDAREAVACMKRALKFRTDDGSRMKHRRRKVAQRRVYYCLFCKGYHLTKWEWWLYGSKKHTTIKSKQYENDFII